MKKSGAAGLTAGSKNTHYPIISGLGVSRPHASDQFLWCDYIELLCFANRDASISRGQLAEILWETRDVAATKADSSVVDGLASQTSVQGLVLDEDDDLYDEDDDEDVRSVLPDSDKNDAKIAGWYGSLAYRAALFGEYYPFELDASGQILKVRGRTKERELYIQLLLSSSLRLVHDTRRNELTEPFEKLSFEVFSRLLSGGWQVHRFGAKGATRYSGKLSARLRLLAADVQAMHLDLKPGDLKKRNSGDGGLDIVAWHPLGGDLRGHIPIAFAQCGCTAEGWGLKSLEASPQAMNYLKVHHPWQTYYFMPLDLAQNRADASGWQRRNQLKECIVIDRFRLIKLADDFDIIDTCVNALPTVVEACGIGIDA